MKQDILPENEADCFNLLIRYKWENGFRCSKCGGKSYWTKPERRIVICKNCRKEVSPLAGTMFHRSRIALVPWFKIIHRLICSPDEVVTAAVIFKEMGLGSYRTAWSVLNRIRFAISSSEPRRVLSGLIEFDEIVISGIGSEYRKISILGALELENDKNLTLHMIKNPDEMNIKDYFKRLFEKKVSVITDPEKLYISNWLELNRIKQIYSHDYYGSNFMNLHIILQDIKYGLKNGHHSVSEKYLQRNLDEYVFIFNNNDDRKNAFYKVLKFMIDTQYSKYLKAENKKNSFFSIILGNNERGAADNSSSKQRAF